MHRGQSILLKSLNIIIGTTPKAAAISGTITILGITSRIIKKIVSNPNPKKDIAAVNRNILTYFSGYNEFLN